MEKRNIKTTGFGDTDKEVLQKRFDEEFQRDYEEAKLRRREAKRRNAQQAGLMRRRMLMEKSLQEEQDELSINHQIGMMIDFVKDNQTPGSLHIDVNSISARSLAKAMWMNQTITSLDLSSCALDDHAGTYIARILNRNNSIKKLELDNNLLGSKACQAFGESLRINTSLEYLSLDSNPLCASDVQGFKSLAEIIRYNNTLVSLNLWRTGITAALGRELANALDANDTILYLDIGHNGVEMIDVKRIADKLDQNMSNYEIAERRRREESYQREQAESIRRKDQDAKIKKEEVSNWLNDQRNQRAEARRKAEEDRIAAAHAEAEEIKRLVELDRAAAKKAAEEAAAKKAKKKDKKNKK